MRRDGVRLPSRQCAFLLLLRMHGSICFQGFAEYAKSRSIVTGEILFVANVAAVTAVSWFVLARVQMLFYCHYIADQPSTSSATLDWYVPASLSEEITDMNIRFMRDAHVYNESYTLLVERIIEACIARCALASYLMRMAGK
jgi:hypothetical protein